MVELEIILVRYQTLQEYPTPCFLALFFFFNPSIIHKCVSLAQYNQVQYHALHAYYVFMLQNFFLKSVHRKPIEISHFS